MKAVFMHWSSQLLANFCWSQSLLTKFINFLVHNMCIVWTSRPNKISLLFENRQKDISPIHNHNEI